MPVDIHGKQYITVAERLQEARDDIKSIITEIVPNGGLIVVRATVTTSKGVFTGTSAANPNKLIEKQSPYEVAETSAVGRALGFAGYGIIEGLATADEMVKVKESTDESSAWLDKDTETKPIKLNCDTCGEEATIKSGTKNGRAWSGLFCSSGDKTHTKWNI